MTSENDMPDPPRETVYSVKVDTFLRQRLEKHLRILKFLDEGGKTKQQWLIEAIKEKLTNTSSESEILSQKANRISVRLNELMNKKLSERVELQKQIRGNYSKKQWLVEAINEKLEREEEEAKKEFLSVQDKLSN